MLGTILLIILIVILIGALPTWPHSSGWGYYPSGGVGLILIIVIVLLCWRIWNERASLASRARSSPCERKGRWRPAIRVLNQEGRQRRPRAFPLRELSTET